MACRNLRSPIQTGFCFDSSHVILRGNTLNSTWTRWNFRSSSQLSWATFSPQMVQPNPITIQAVTTMPMSVEKQWVGRFLGAIDCLSKFCPLLSRVAQPLCNSPKDSAQNTNNPGWSASSSHPFAMPGMLWCVHSGYFSSCCFSLWSRRSSCTTNQKKIIEACCLQFKSLTDLAALHSNWKEMLAIIEAFTKFNQWLIGKLNIAVHIDHVSLQSIIQKALASAPKCLKKMMLLRQCNTVQVT